MASRVTPLAVEVEGVEVKGGTVEVVGSVVSTRGCFGRHWALLRRTEPTLIPLGRVKMY